MQTLDNAKSFDSFSNNLFRFFQPIIVYVITFITFSAYCISIICFPHIVFLSFGNLKMKVIIDNVNSLIIHFSFE